VSSVAVVLRLLTDPAGEGRLVGQAEVVDTGELVPIRGTDDLVALVWRLRAEVAAR
jgi:hypothetical protein